MRELLRGDASSNEETLASSSPLEAPFLACCDASAIAVSRAGDACVAVCRWLPALGARGGTSSLGARGGDATRLRAALAHNSSAETFEDSGAMSSPPPLKPLSQRAIPVRSSALTAELNAASRAF